ncbi:MAG: DUF2793 domain-containing protein [Pseudomonadota bacterium]
MSDFDYTENLQMPYIMAGQAQKHITHNEALRMIDALLHVAITQVGLTVPPSAPLPAGARYIVGAAATGAWTGQDQKIAAWQDGAWFFYAPHQGWVVYALDGQSLLAFDGTQWSPLDAQQEQLGVNTVADATNRLAVKSDAVFFSHDDVTPGSGDQRFTLNMAGSANTASLMFATNWAGHAEIGLMGSRDLTFKVSGDGVSWADAMQMDAATGKVSMPVGLEVQHVQVFKDQTTQILTQTAAAVAGWDGHHALAGADLTWDPALGECALGRAGLHMISYAVSTEISAGQDRSDSVAYLQRYDGSNWIDVKGSVMRMYNRLAARGGTAAAWTGLLNLNAGEAVRLAARMEQGSDTVIIDQASLMIMRI